MTTPRKPLQWHGDEDGRLGWPLCDTCFDKFMDPAVVGACASVGIEHGRSTASLLRECIDRYHENRHEEEVAA